MKAIALYILFTIGLKTLHAQTEDTIPKLAIFLPVKLSNYFDDKLKPKGDILKEAKNSIDYYYGVKLAAEALGKNGTKININIYELNSAINLDSIYNTSSFNGTSLIMAPVKEDLKQLAAFAKKHEIPLVSTIYPYDASVVNNGQLYIANPTLRVHVEEMYNFMATKIKTKKWNNTNVLLVETKNNKDEFLHKHFEDFKNNQVEQKLISSTTVLNSYKELNLLMLKLDSTKSNIIYALTLNDTLNNAILKMASKNPKYNITVLGLPYWENFDFLKDEAFKNATYVFSTSFNKFESDSLFNVPILKAYQKKYPGITPSYAFYKSYLYTLKYATLLAKYKADFVAHINEYDMLENNKLKFAPYFSIGDNLMVNYNENRKLYFITKQGTKFKAID